MEKVVRLARIEDLDRILGLGRQFGHQMGYQKDPELMEKCLPRIIVVETPAVDMNRSMKEGVWRDTASVTGYYHYILSTDPGFKEMLLHWRQMPATLLVSSEFLEEKPLCVIMQGGCHRDDFELLVKHLQAQYPIIWTWNSWSDPKNPSGKIDGYKKLGFKYSDELIFKFWNLNKFDYSTYRLGTWVKTHK